MKRLAVLLVLIAGCQLPTREEPKVEAEKPKTATLSNAQSRPIKAELNKKLDEAAKVFHAGCRDPEKASCTLDNRVCADKIEKQMKGALAKGTVIVEWEEPRETWAENYAVLNHYWLVNKDGSGTYYWLIPSPDDVKTDCGNGMYCGWHKEDLAAGTLFADAKFHLTPYGKQPIADLDHCPEPPPQPGMN